MSRFLESRRRMISLRGRTMRLTRLGGTPPGSTTTNVNLSGVMHHYAPSELVAGIVQGDVRVEILNDEIATNNWPGPPRKGDRLLIDGRTYVLQGSTPAHDGAQVIGHSLWARGG